jgi:metal-responsive CopG/Arc/MetJ family transcriptional regulator
MIPAKHEEGGERLIRMPVALPEDLHEWLREAAFRRRASMAELLREALREYRDRIDPQLELPIPGGGGE